MTTREWLAALWANVKRSWTMIAAVLLAVGGVFEQQFQLLKPYMGEKTWAVLYFSGLAIIAIARVRTLRP